MFKNSTEFFLEPGFKILCIALRIWLIHRKWIDKKKVYENWTPKRFDYYCWIWRRKRNSRDKSKNCKIMVSIVDEYNINTWPNASHDHIQNSFQFRFNLICDMFDSLIKVKMNKSHLGWLHYYYYYYCFRELPLCRWVLFPSSFSVFFWDFEPFNEWATKTKLNNIEKCKT